MKQSYLGFAKVQMEFGLLCYLLNIVRIQWKGRKTKAALDGTKIKWQRRHLDELWSFSSWNAVQMALMKIFFILALPITANHRLRNTGAIKVREV